MSLRLIFVMLSAVSTEPGPTVPIEAFGPMGRYMQCLFEPLESLRIPAGVTAREQLVRTMLRNCQEVRRSTMAEATALVPEANRDPSPVETFYQDWEARLRLMVVENERWRASAED